MGTRDCFEMADCGVITVCGRRYRKAPITRADPYLRGLDSTASEHDPDINERLGGGGPCAQLTDEQCDFDEASGEHRATVELPGQFIGHLIGKGGSKLKQMQQETGATIVAPNKANSKPGRLATVQICGPAAAGVLSAKTRIQLLAEECRDRADFTHFINVPLADGSTKAQLVAFSQQVAATCGDSQGFDPSLCVQPNRLHLTLVMLKLMTEAEVKAAVAALRGCQASVNELLMASGGLTVSLTGLEYMNDDPAQVDVLYIKVGRAGATVKAICDTIAAAMLAAGVLSQPQMDQQRLSNIKLHATLMNSKYRANSGAGGRETFDATRILELFGEFDFGTVTVPHVLLSEVHRTKPMKADEKYHYPTVAQIQTYHRE